MKPHRGDYLLFVGRMSPDKGCHRAIDIAVRAGLPLKIAGKRREPAEIAYFEEYVRPHLSSEIEYLGEVTHGEKVELLQHARATLFPIEWEEPFGLVMIESMACGTPVIATRIGAVPEVIEHGRSGIIVDDYREMVAALEEADRLEPEALRAFAEERYSPERMVADYVQAYSDHIERTRRDGARVAPAGRLPRRERRRGRRPHGRRRPLPRHRRQRAVRGPVARRAAQARLRGARGAARGWHHSRIANHDESGGDMSDLQTEVRNVIEGEPVALFMKGTPQMIMCGNSKRALDALRRAGAPVTTVDILPDPAIRQELSAQSGWPTVPQIFVKGELIGGADITEELEASGELERKLEEALGADYRESREEKVVSLV